MRRCIKLSEHYDRIMLFGECGCGLDFNLKPKKV